MISIKSKLEQIIPLILVVIENMNILDTDTQKITMAKSKHAMF